ncbi:DUF2243 domain-containing protein [Alicyclobacillus fastidiosus]|uniref:DUF2243 domain-containing protein n=1 Tax=Alicyclobacillus fastidiosus TaxID=392011 RepID=A0ABV5AJJ2_9BACL|nr:DUF2243 domain-containing protein [Alicyclobacillus fastidiosus]WEH08355.1 DUF2243 domain-containing protein [Alicyclobacillus fastidiosus]
MNPKSNNQDRTLLGAFLFGFGLIAMIDGIVFHQLLQWHSTYMWHPNRFVQIFSDGVLHAIATAFVVLGAIVLWNSNPTSTSAKNTTLWSGLFLGGGSFNLLDGVFSHHILGIHHVRPGDPNQVTYDLAFDLSAILMLLVGLALHRNAKHVIRS